MSFFNPPKPPDPKTTANFQAGYNKQAAQAQNQTNMFGQTTPYGSLSWNVDPSAPGGYSAQTALNPQQQTLLNLQVGAQTPLGGAAQNLAQNAQGLYSSLPNLSTDAITNQLMGWQQKYVNPIFNQQKSNLDAQLANQGLNINDVAYQNAQNLLARNQGDVNTNFLTAAEPLAFQQAIQQYQLPAQTIGGLMGMTAPTQNNFVQTPTAQIQPPNYQGIAEQNYQSQMQQYGNMMSGLFGIPTALAGGWAKGGFAMPSFGG